MMSVPVVKQAMPSSGGGTTGPVGGGPGAGPPSSQSPGKMVTPGPQPGSNILPKSANPGNPMVGSMGGHSVTQAGGMGQNLQNSSLMKQVPPAASSMPISMVANHTASAQSMVHQSLSGVGGAGTMAPLSLVPEHRTPATGVPQPTPPVAHNHPAPPMPTQRGSAPPAHSTAPPSTHPPQSGPAGNPMMGSGQDKPKELIVGGKPTSNGVQMQKAGEASGAAQQQARKVSDGPVSLVVNHSMPETSGNVSATNVAPQQTQQQAHSLTAPAPASSVQMSPVKPDAAVANHATSQPSKSGLAASAAVANKVSSAPSPVKEKAPPTPTKSVPATAAPKAPTPSEANDVSAKSATPAPSSGPQSTTSQPTTVKAPAAAAGASPAKPSAPAAPAAAAAVPTAAAAPSESADSSSQGVGASEASVAAASASPAKPAATPTSSSVTEEPKANNQAPPSSPAKTSAESKNTDDKASTPAEAESATPSAAASADKEGKSNPPPSTTQSRGSKRKRTEIKSPAPTLGSSQAAAIAAASRTPSSKNKSQIDSGIAKKDEGGEDDDDEERKPKRVRIRTQPYQSPLPELAYLPKFTRTPTSKAQEDKLILFYKNEFLAVRNAEGGFYVCQTMQNIYKHSARIRIRWLSQDTAPKTDEEKDQSTNDGEVYSPDFYDLTDFDCILTNLNLDRLERGKYRLPNVELERTQSILKRAIDAEKGVGQKTPLTEEHPDGLDLSLYRDESQLKKRRSQQRKSGTGKAKSADGAKAKQEDGKEKESSSSSSSSSEDEAEEEAGESSAKKPKREKRAPQQQPALKESSNPVTPRARGAREMGKRKTGAESEGKAKATPSATASKKRNNSSTPARKRRSEAPAAAAPATPATTPARATPARATRSPKSAPAPSRKERSRVKEARKKPGKKA